MEVTYFFKSIFFYRFGLKTHFIDSVVVPPATEFIRVICTTNNTQVYEDYFTFVPNKHNFQVSSKPKLNVLIFGLDSLFRENFHREMPQTAKTLKKLNFIEFSGYTRISKNKFSNLIALLTGYNELELQSVCWPEISEYFDKCPFIWQKYRDQNYTTAFAEDNSGMSLFTSWGKSGFINPPTDYYYYPFGKKVGETISREYYGIPRFCFGSKRSIDFFLDYSTKLVTNLKDAPLFGVLLASTLSHDYLNLPRISDLEFQQLFNFMNDTNFLETSIIIFMGDCGLSGDPNMKTKTRRLESKMPLFTVSFPKWFPQKYPSAYKHFVTNSKRLTNHFDFYETLSDLTDLDNLRNDVIVERTHQLNSLVQPPRGISLFLPISETRTCQQAEIPSIHCPCMVNEGK